MGKYSRYKPIKSKNVTGTPPPSVFQGVVEEPGVAMWKWEKEMTEKYQFSPKDMDTFRQICSRALFLEYCSANDISFSVSKPES